MCWKYSLTSWPQSMLSVFTCLQAGLVSVVMKLSVTQLRHQRVSHPLGRLQIHRLTAGSRSTCSAHHSCEFDVAAPELVLHLLQVLLGVVF